MKPSIQSVCAQVNSSYWPAHGDTVRITTDKGHLSVWCRITNTHTGRCELVTSYSTLSASLQALFDGKLGQARDRINACCGNDRRRHDKSLARLVDPEIEVLEFELEPEPRCELHLRLHLPALHRLTIRPAGYITVIRYPT